jgi:hypothetical protein
MNEATSNTDTLPVPNVAQPIATPIAPPKPKAKAKGKGKAKSTSLVKVDAQSVDWAHLPKGVIAHRKGDEYTAYSKKLGKDVKRTYPSDVLFIPSVRKLMDLNPGMTQQAAETLVRDAGTKVKPGVMGELSKAGASAAFVVRRYSNRLSDKAQDIAVTLHRVNVESTVDKLAREYNMTPEEVRKRLNITETAV